MPNDIFGIKMIYPPDAAGEEWYLDDDPENDGQLDSDPETIEAVGDYFIVTNSADAILAVSGASGVPTGDCAVDYSHLTGQGYRYTSSDWKDQEQTIFLYIQDAPSDEWCAIRGRDFSRSLIGGEDPCCEEVRYGIRIYNAPSGSNAGMVQFSKVLNGQIGTAPAVKQTVVPTFYRRWVGHKFIIYNVMGSNNQEQVRLEHWICPSDSATDKANSWTLVNSFIDTGSNLGTSSSACGGNTRQAITWGNINCSINLTGDEIRFKNWSIRAIDLNGDFGGGGGSGGGGDTGTGNCGSIDTLGIKWMVGSGEQTVIEQSRDDSNDYRWSQNYQNILPGYEATVIGTFDGVASGGHMALKHWGPNHSGDCGYEEGGDCCCWYDTGIRANGDVQTQIERPHPSNSDWDCPECTMSNIGKGMDGNSIGLKWLVYPVQAGGNVDVGGMKLKMWVDTDPLDGNGRPNNNWVLVYDITDNPTRDILADYDAPDEQEIELRVSDTDTADMYGGGVHVRRLRRPEDLVPCVPDGDGGGGGGGGNEDPVCPTGYHWVESRQLCVADGGGGTNPDPPIPETLYNDFKLIYNILSDSDGCICNPAPYTPPPPPPPPPECPPGQHYDPVQLICVDDSVPPPPPPPPGDALYNVGYTGGTEVQIGMDSGNSSRYLQYGIWIRGSQSQILGTVVKRGEIALKKVGAPTGLAYVRIRNGDTDAIETELGTIDADEVGSSPQYYAAENLSATYTVLEDDRLMIEFDGGDEDNYLVGYRQSAIEGNDTKVTKRSNTHSEGDYSSDDKEFASKWYA